jgi:hypothetical protein
MCPIHLQRTWRRFLRPFFGETALPICEMPAKLPSRSDGGERIMQKTFCLSLFCCIVLGGAAFTQAERAALLVGGQPASAMDPTVAPTAYVQDMEAGKRDSTDQNGQYDGNSRCDSCLGRTCDGYFAQCLCGDSGIIGGYDFLFLKPHCSYGYSYSSYSDDGLHRDNELYGYSTNYAFTPRFWLGYQGCQGLGARVRYMQYDQQLMAADVTAPADRTFYYSNLSAAPGEELHFHDYLEMHVLDAEFTQDLTWRCAKLTAGAGVRYATLAFSGDGYVGSGEVTQETTVYRDGFEGVGPTLSLDVKAPIRQSALSFVGGLRGSVLFGRSPATYEWRNLIADESYNEHGTGDRTMSVLEGSVGLQYDYSLSNHLYGFIRFAWEGQLWFNAASSEFSDDLGMEGLCIAVGISR